MTHVFYISVSKMARTFYGQVDHVISSLPRGSVFPGLAGMGPVIGSDPLPRIPNMGGLPGMKQEDVGYSTANSGHSNQVNPITYQTGIDLTDDSGSVMGKYELCILKREPSSNAGTGHVCKTWAAMNQYLFEHEGWAKYSTLKHHAESNEALRTRGLTVDWNWFQNVQVNQLEKYEQVGYFNEWITNFHVARRVELFDVWKADDRATIRQGVSLFSVLVKMAFDTDVSRLASVEHVSRKYSPLEADVSSQPLRSLEKQLDSVSHITQKYSAKKKAFEYSEKPNTQYYDNMIERAMGLNTDILTEQLEKDVLRSSSSRHRITWQALPYASISPAGPPRDMYDNDTFGGCSFDIGVVGETYPTKRCETLADEQHHARMALFPSYRGVASNWREQYKNAQNNLSRLTVYYRV